MIVRYVILFNTSFPIAEDKIESLQAKWKQPLTFGSYHGNAARFYVGYKQLFADVVLWFHTFKDAVEFCHDLDVQVCVVGNGRVRLYYSGRYVGTLSPCTKSALLREPPYEPVNCS